jgi:hypothetical protein
MSIKLMCIWWSLIYFIRLLPMTSDQLCCIINVSLTWLSSCTYIADKCDERTIINFIFLRNISASYLTGGLDMMLTTHMHLVSRIRVIRAKLPVLRMPSWHAPGQLRLYCYSNVYGRVSKPCNFLRVQ